MILFFLNNQFPDTQNMVTAKKPLELDIDYDKMRSLFNAKDYKENYKILQKSVRALKLNIPPLINAYMNLSPSMKFFGTSINDAFGEVEESGIMITINDIFPAKTERHIKTYIRNRLLKVFKRRK